MYWMYKKPAQNMANLKTQLEVLKRELPWSSLKKTLVFSLKKIQAEKKPWPSSFCIHISCDLPWSSPPNNRWSDETGERKHGVADSWGRETVSLKLNFCCSLLASVNVRTVWLLIIKPPSSINLESWHKTTTTRSWGGSKDDCLKKENNAEFNNFTFGNFCSCAFKIYGLVKITYSKC